MSYRKGIKMDSLVHLRTRPGRWWLRPLLSAGNTVMAIPVRDGIPIVHLFEIIDKSEVINEQETKGGSK